jgi:16S rRNA U516 pseudouridylate synthase RsuA-like enzyme
LGIDYGKWSRKFRQVRKWFIEAGFPTLRLVRVRIEQHGKT